MNFSPDREINARGQKCFNPKIGVNNKYPSGKHRLFCGYFIPRHTLLGKCVNLVIYHDRKQNKEVHATIHT